MSLATATVWFDLHQLLGGDFTDTRRTKAYVTTNVENGTLINTTTGEIRMGDQAVTINTDGTGEFSTWNPGSEANPTSWQTSLVVDYPRTGHHDRARRVFGPYTITNTSRAVTNKALTSNIATLTVSAAHGLRVGDSVGVGSVDATFNGVYTITAVPSPTTFSYAKTAADVASVAATGVISSGSVSLALLEDEQAIPPNYQTMFTASMEVIRDEAEAARDETNANINGLGIGTTTTGAAGSNAAVTLTGTAPDRDFNFTIPRGDQGLPGPGSAAWTASQAVVVGSVRQAPDGSWIKSTAARTTRSTFDATEQGFWTPVAATAGTMEQAALVAENRKKYGLGLSPYNFGAVGDGVTDDHVALQAFFDYVTANNAGVCNVAGTFLSSTALTMGAALTKQFVGKFDLTVTGSGGAALTVTDWSLGSWQHMKLTAPQGGTTNYAARTWHTGLHVTGNTQRCKFGTIEGTDWSFALVAASGGNTSGNGYGIVKATSCGSGMVSGATHYGLTTSWSNPVNSGSSGSVSQTCVIDVTTLPPTYISSGFHGAVNDAPYMIRITNNLDGTTRLHYITAVDTVNSKLTVFPWINPAITPSTADYVYGGALYLQGADSNVSTYSLVDAIRCGVAVSAASLYAPTAGRIITQVCGAGIVLGRVPTGAVLGGRFSGYFESNTEDIIYLSRPISSNVYTWFSNEYALNLTKCYVAGAAKLSTTFADTDAHRGFENTSLAYQGRMHAYEKRPGAPSSTQLVAINRADMQLRLSGNTFTITPSIDTNLNRLFGYDSMRVTVVGTGTNGAPTGTITFPVPAGYTLNGGSSSVAYSSFTGPAEFIYRFDVANATATVRQAAQPALSATATLDFPSIAAAGQQELTVTVTGAVVGDLVILGPPSALEAGLQATGYVSAANTVKVRLSNVTAAAIDPASATWKAAVIR